jgi:hypothetical protein
MNKGTILSDLREAKEELDNLIDEIEKDTDFDFDGYYVPVQHIYHHLNTAWNIRKESEETIKEYSEDNFNKWRRFPNNDFDMGI